MALTDLFSRKLKHSSKPSGDKYSDGRALFLLVKKSNKYWRMNYRFMDEVLGKRVDLIEHQLAHRVIDPNGRAYNRTAHLPARAAMMQRWVDYLDKLRTGADVIPLRAVTGPGPGPQ